jgi:hypothetical protein
MKASIFCLPSVSRSIGRSAITYNALVLHAKLMKSTDALWTKVLPKFA